MVYTTFVPDCGSVRKILVDGNVTLFLVASSACHRFYTQWACQRNPVATPIAASVQNLYIYLMAHMCQRPRPVNGAIFIYIIQNTAPRGRYPERTACITLAWLRVGGRTPDAAILFSRLCITQTKTQLTHKRSVADSLLETGRAQRPQTSR